MRLPRKLYFQMLGHGEKELPYEACGLLSGSKESIKTVWKAINNQRKRNSFEINEAQFTSILYDMEKKKECFIGIYHTHPTAPPIPSSDDIRHAFPDKVYFIISYAKKKPIIKCYKISNDNVLPIRIILTD
ncbi:M67 family metallopeptidase [Cytobacillus firmus]|uniref:M67 family metallopeptidase n=1 Tax=Cytobacillus firmus TaxID=1399 RepID=UPI003749800F